MRLAQLVAAVYDAFDVPAAVADVAALCEHDRYQASAGIDAAAAYVAERADAAGLVDVDVLMFPADGARRWWTFAAPVRWTPLRATVHVDGEPVLRYPEQPYALAAYSAATPPDGVRLPVVRWSPGSGRQGDRPPPAGALVVLEGTPLPAVLDELVSCHAAGVVADPLAGRGNRLPDQVGRIELPAGCPLFAFSATEQQLATLARASTAQVLVEVDTEPGTLPVVTGRLPYRHRDGPDLAGSGGAGAIGAGATGGDPIRAGPGGGTGRDDPREDGELLLSAHLCHPRPSANDNASGVAALLGIARAHAALPGTGGRAVRFVWGPELVGLAAYLHDVVHLGGLAPRPIVAVNVDMAGEDQHRCGGPLVIERAPDELASPVSAIAERCAALLPAAARSYSGAVPCDTWTWRATPYVGASDHAMLNGRPTSCPSVSLGHWPDIANHTSADTLDLVDGEELRRAATIAGATIGAFRLAGTDRELIVDLAAGTAAWAAAHVLSALPGARAQPPPVTAGPVLDPWAPEHAARLLEHRAAVAVRTVPPGAAEWIAGLVDHVRKLVVPRPAEPAREPDEADVLYPAWPGPMNLRHLAERAAPDDRRWLAGVLARDRGGGYARLLALARGLDGRRDRRAVAWWAALASELAIPVPMARRFLQMLCEAGWARNTKGDDAASPHPGPHPGRGDVTSSQDNGTGEA